MTPLIIAAVVVVMAAIAAWAYIQTRPQRTFLDQLLGGLGSGGGVLAALM